MAAKEWASVLAVSLPALLAPAFAGAVEVVFAEVGSTFVVADNGPDDENPAVGVIDLSLFLITEFDIENFRCQAEVDGFRASARVLPITGSEVRVAKFGSGPSRVGIECRHPLGFEIWGPGATERAASGEAEDSLGGTLDIIRLADFFGDLLPPGSVPAAGPCPSGGGAQPCAFDRTVVGDFPAPVFVADTVSVPLEIEIGESDEVRFSRVTHEVSGRARPVPVLGAWGTAVLAGSLLAAGRRARGSIAAARRLS